MPRIFVALIISIFSFLSHAAFSNFNSIVLGDRISGMGGAGTAIVGDVAAAAFYNPATLGMLEGKAFSASAGIYKKYDIVFGRTEDLLQVPLRINQGFFHALPASTGNVLEWRGLVLSLNILAPDYEIFRGDLRNRDGFVSSLSYLEENIWTGVGIGKRISKNESIGLTLYYTARNFTRAAVDRHNIDSANTRFYTHDFTVKENTVVPVLGYYREWDDSAFGVSLRPRSIPVSGSASLVVSNTVVTGGTVTIESITATNEKSRPVIPGKLTFGYTHELIPHLTMSYDLSLYERIAYDDLLNPDFSVPVLHKGIWNINLGGEYDLLDWFKIRSGIYTNFSSHPDPDPDRKQYQPDHVDMLGFSANAVFIADNKISFTFGGYYTGGWGRSMQRVGQNWEVLTKNVNVFTMLVGTAFHF
ncbi:MAG: hypothetical protein N2578_03640 [Bdellovibrionaceae bacterium]|nr:hypothetical protein [Pseudobdellovibrionaceae bacterium]